MNPNIDSDDKFDFQLRESEDIVILESSSGTQNHNQKQPVLFVPEDFNPLEFLAENRKGCDDRARYLLHTIHTQSIFNHRDRKKGVSLKAEYLRNFMSKKHYKGIIQDLEAGGVIEVERIARDGQCNLYRLAGDFRNKIFRRYCPQDGYLIRKLNTWRAEQDQNLTCTTRRHLKSQLNRVRINYEAACDCLFGLPLTENGYSDCLNCLLRLNEQDWYFVADRYGRVHHNVSCLKRELRQFLHVDGESLIELDISNSQPLFCALTYFIWKKNNYSFANIHSSDSLSDISFLKEENLDQLILIKQSLQSQINNTNISNSYIYPLRCPSLDNVNNDALKYLELCEQGRIYEFLAGKTNEDISDGKKRGQFKEKVFKELLYAKWRDHQKVLVKVFQNEFPSIYQMIKTVNYKDHSRLATWMQRVESELVIDRVVKRFMQERSNGFILTIHDSVLTKKCDAVFANQLFKEEFGKFNVCPTLNMK